MPEDNGEGEIMELNDRLEAGEFKRMDCRKGQKWGQQPEYMTY